MNDYILSVRAIENGAFVPEVGPTQFLIVSGNQPLTPDSAVKNKEDWYKAVRSAAEWKNDSGDLRGDILFIVHGYNNSEADVIQRHRRLRDDLNALGFKGVVVSFDWPSDNNALAYLPDRHRAKISALNLVTDGILYLSKTQTPDCTTNVHVLGHSTGAYVVREAFDDADDHNGVNTGWGVSQVIFAAGDVSSESMSDGKSDTDSLYGHCVRLTNYFNKHDEALDLSNVKRLGTAPRAGRIGLPDDAPQSAVNINCTFYYEQLTADQSAIVSIDEPTGLPAGMPSHSWYFGNLIFTQDLFDVIIGKDRTVIPTRIIEPDGKIDLRHI
jgi:esterase/lipase superfamily enzyme